MTSYIIIERNRDQRSSNDLKLRRLTLRLYLRRNQMQLLWRVLSRYCNNNRPVKRLRLVQDVPTRKVDSVLPRNKQEHVLEVCE